LLELPKVSLQRRFVDFLEEDVGLGDITTEAVVPSGTKTRAQIVMKEASVVAGLSEVGILFETLGTKFAAKAKDGDEVASGAIVAYVEGDGRVVLETERTVLNILMRMSGIATATRNLVKKVKGAGLDVRIAATRKTAPGLRYFDKKAVVIGGGDPHRFRLDDAYLVKDNHIRIAKGMRHAIERIRSVASFPKTLEVEAKTLEQAVEAAELGVNAVMLDNMTPKEAEKTMKALTAKNLRNKTLIEISGGVSEENLLEYARLRPDVISLGSLTHSVRAVDMSLEVIDTDNKK